MHYNGDNMHQLSNLILWNAPCWWYWSGFQVSFV